MGGFLLGFYMWGLYFNWKYYILNPAPKSSMAKKNHKHYKTKRKGTKTE